MLRWLFHNTLITGDNVRLAAQRPVLRRMLPARSRAALDAGAGGGEYTRTLLLPRAERVLAVDIEEEHLRRLSGRLTGEERGRCALAAGTLTDVPARDGAFDLVLCSEVLEHCEDDGAVVAELARVTAPGGVLVVAVPVPPAPYPDGAHVREGYTAGELRGLLERHGFEVTDHAHCLFALSRWTLRLRHRVGTRMPLPLMFLIHLERLLYARAGEDSLPFDVVMRAVRR